MFSGLYHKKLIFAVLAIAFASMAYFSVSFALMLLVWLSPSICVFVIDHEYNGHLTANVAMFNIAAVLKQLIMICKNADNIIIEKIAIHAFQTNRYTMIIFSISLLGWIMHYMMPMILTKILSSCISIKIGAMQKRISRLRKEWGIR